MTYTAKHKAFAGLQWLGIPIHAVLLHAGDGVAITDPSTRVESEALRASLSVTL